MNPNIAYRFDAGFLEGDGPGLFGASPFLFDLLEMIQREGSISKAAQALDVSYRHAWSQLKKQEETLGQSLVVCPKGEAARLAGFGERLLWAERRVTARQQPVAEALAAQRENALLRALHPEFVSLSLSAGYDPLFAPLRQDLSRGADTLLDIEYQGCVQALERLNAGECLLAGVHLPLNAPALCQRGTRFHYLVGRQLRLGEHKMMRLAGRQQGLIVAPGNPKRLHSVQCLARLGVRFINRQCDSGSRILFDELLYRGRVLADSIDGYNVEEPSHLAVAAAVASSAVDTGFGLKSAADQFSLDFVPLIDEDYFIVCRKATLDLPAVQALVDVVQSSHFRTQIECLPGYDGTNAGQIVSLRQMLPWYK